MSRQRRRYDDKFRAGAVVMLEAAGYPQTKGALQKTATHLGVPVNTLKGWFLAEHNPPPANLRIEKEFDLVTALRSEIRAALGEAPRARPDADYKSLITGVAIMVDKLQLLTGKPTEIVENVESPLEQLRSRIAGIVTGERERSSIGRTNGHGSGEAAV